MNINEVSCSGVYWINLAQDRAQRRAVVSTVTNLRVLKNVGNLLTSWATSSFSMLPWLLAALYSPSGRYLLAMGTKETSKYSEAAWQRSWTMERTSNRSLEQKKDKPELTCLSGLSAFPSHGFSNKSARKHSIARGPQGVPCLVARATTVTTPTHLVLSWQDHWWSGKDMKGNERAGVLLGRRFSTVGVPVETGTLRLPNTCWVQPTTEARVALWLPAACSRQTEPNRTSSQRFLLFSSTARRQDDLTYLLFCMGVKLGVSHWGRDIDRGLAGQTVTWHDMTLHDIWSRCIFHGPLNVKPDKEGRIILEFILEERMLGCEQDWSGSHQGPMASCCDRGKEFLGSLEARLSL
jgi:hypothetical protein